MKTIKHLFFDLDHTLWDYDKSARETLLAIHKMLNLNADTSTFLEVFYDVNNQLWHLYNEGKIDREYIKKSRFEQIFEKMGEDVSRSPEASSYFLNECSNKPYLMEDALTALRHLEGRYQLHIITNGFNDSQGRKLRKSGIFDFFDVVVTSESTGSKKPDLEIFLHAMKLAKAKPNESAMIGDNTSTDIKGAKRAGMLAVLYDPSGKKRSMADLSIQSHLEMIQLF